MSGEGAQQASVPWPPRVGLVPPDLWKESGSAAQAHARQARAEKPSDSRHGVSPLGFPSNLMAFPPSPFDQSFGLATPRSLPAITTPLLALAYCFTTLYMPDSSFALLLCGKVHDKNWLTKASGPRPGRRSYHADTLMVSQSFAL